MAIARALVNSPRLILADEPTGNLDADTSDEVMHLLESLRRDRGCTLMVVTHDRALAGPGDPAAGPGSRTDHVRRPRRAPGPSGSDDRPMSWADAFRLAARSVLRRPGRAALTVVAVALAAALFTAMLTMAATAQGRVLNQLAKGGPLAGIQVAAAAPDPSQAGVDNPARGAPKPIDQAALDRISRIRGVDVVLPIVTAESLVAWPGHTATGGNVVRTEQLRQRRLRPAGGHRPVPPRPTSR